MKKLSPETIQKIYDKTLNDADAWLMTADELLSASKCLSNNKERHIFSGVMLMLKSMALECLLKRKYLTLGKTLSEDGEF